MLAMMLLKTLSFACAGWLVAAAGAQAADLPTRKAAPVDYVRICSVYGPGFFYIPGTDTCIRIGGRVRFEYEYVQPSGHVDSTGGTNTLARFILDARTATDWGTLRAYGAFDVRRRTGAWFGSGTAIRMGNTENFQGAVGSFPGYAGIDVAGGKLESSAYIPLAYVQWGGLTAGHVQSFFDFFADTDSWHELNVSEVKTTALAYSYAFGSGLSATLSLEDGIERRNVIAGTGTVAAGNIFPSTFAGAAYSNFAITYPSLANPIFNGGGAAAINTSQRESVPDVVAALRVDQGWGSAQLSGAWHHVSTSGSTVTTTALTPGSVVSSVAGGYLGRDAEGWAIQGGIKIKLPMISEGDNLWLQAAYSKGGLAYVNSGYPKQESASAYAYSGAIVGASTLAGYDAILNPAGQLKLTPAWSAMADYLHYWTPNIRQAVFGSYFRESFGSSIRRAAAYAEGAACPACVGSTITATGAVYNPFSPFYVDGAQWQVGSNITWSPVKNLDIGVELLYVVEEDGHRHFDANKGYPYLVSHDSQWLSRVRVQRDF